MLTCSNKFRKISACSLDKENFLKEITKVLHDVSYRILNSIFNLTKQSNVRYKLTEDKMTNSQFQFHYHRHLHYGFNFAEKL